MEQIIQYSAKVLIISSDLYDRVGGGETVYRNLIKNNLSIQFFFFSTPNALNRDLPANAVPIPFKSYPRLKKTKKNSKFDLQQSTKSRHTLNPHQAHAAEISERYALSAKGLKFDLIDVPEYEIVGDFLKEALTRHNVEYKKIALFIHGSLSNTLKFEDKMSQNEIKQLQEIEKCQRESVDLFFILNNWYPKKLGIDLTKCITINPWLFVSDKQANTTRNLNKDESRLFFFGRFEKRKGADLLPELLTLVTKQKLPIILSGEKLGNEKYIKQIVLAASNRNLEIWDLNTKDSSYLYNQISENDILAIPTRFDSFNLIALEAIAAGKFLMLSKESGAYHFLKEHHPELKFAEFDPYNLVESAREIDSYLQNFESFKTLIDSNSKICKEILSGVSKEQYTREILAQLDANKNLNFSHNYKLEFRNFSLVVRLIYSSVTGGLFIGKRKLSSIKQLVNLFQKQKSVGSLFLVALYLNALFRNRKNTLNLDKKERNLYIRPKHFLKMSSSDALTSIRSLTYAVRSLRFAGYNSQEIDTSNILYGLKEIGLEEEANALNNILVDHSSDEVFNYLENRRRDLLKTPLFNFGSDLIQESKKSSKNPKISIIVSSFNASSKLKVFLNRLSMCPELLTGEAEILLIDANSFSPDAHLAVGIADELGISLRSIRLHRRITIQEAWNYGILNARGEFLSFLGVDETIHPTALTELSQVLEHDQNVDWVMSNTIVTEVDGNGCFMKDVMIYNRKDADVASPFLETCYVSYVGGMYRKNIHQKFGYYDPTFKGAGDTEFKSRVLPSLKVSYLNKTLGEFLNYPEERTTATERVELEDIRAWYIFRTPGGLKYQTSLAGVSFLESLGTGTLGYRKSYCGHLSTDIEMASAIWKIAKSENYQINEGLMSELENANQQMEALRKFLGFNTHKHGRLKFLTFVSLTRWFDIEGRKNAAKGARRMRLDNMLEQHIWYW